MIKLGKDMPLQVVPPFPAKGSTRGEAVDSERVKKYYTLSVQQLTFPAYASHGLEKLIASNPQLHSVPKGQEALR